MGLRENGEKISAVVLSTLRGRGCGAAFPDLILPTGLVSPNLNTVFWANNGLVSVPVVLVESFRASMRLLDLAHNAICDLGQELFNLINLRDLSLAGNRLRAVTPALGQMSHLQQLWLHGNALEELPEELGNLQISLSWSCITTV